MAYPKFSGFRRQGGRAGARNDVWLISACAETNGLARRIASIYHKPYWIDEVRVVEHSPGATPEAISSLARSPSACAAMIVGADGAADEAAALVGFDAAQKRIRAVSADDLDEAEALEMLDEVAAFTPRVRERFPISDLRVGIAACGGGAAALTGALADLLVSHWCSVIMPVSCEIFPAIDEIYGRIEDEREAEKLRAAAEDEALVRGAPATISDVDRASALLSHGGSAPIVRVMEMGERSTGERGLQLVLAAPGIASFCSAAAASGAGIIVAATDSAAPFGSIVPTIRVSADPRLIENERAAIDFDASYAARDAESEARRMLEMILDAAGGERTKTECLGTCAFCW